MKTTRCNIGLSHDTLLLLLPVGSRCQLRRRRRRWRWRRWTGVVEGWRRRVVRARGQPFAFGQCPQSAGAPAARPSTGAAAGARPSTGACRSAPARAPGPAQAPVPAPAARPSAGARPSQGDVRTFWVCPRLRRAPWAGPLAGPARRSGRRGSGRWRSRRIPARRRRGSRPADCGPGAENRAGAGRLIARVGASAGEQPAGTRREPAAAVGESRPAAR